MTIREWLEGVAANSSSTDDDAMRMQNLLRRMGFAKAKVVMGMVYPEGYGRPVSIQGMAGMMLKQWAAKGGTTCRDASRAA